MGKLMKTERVL